MDSADSDHVRAALEAQGSRIHHQEEPLAILCQEIRDMVERQERYMASSRDQICCLTDNLQKLQLQPDLSPVSSPPPVSPATEATASISKSTPFPHLSKPERFSDES